MKPRQIAIGLAASVACYVAAMTLTFAAQSTGDHHPAPTSTPTTGASFSGAKPEITPTATPTPPAPEPTTAAAEHPEAVPAEQPRIEAPAPLYQPAQAAPAPAPIQPVAAPAPARTPTPAATLAAPQPTKPDCAHLKLGDAYAGISLECPPTQTPTPTPAPTRTPDITCQAIGCPTLDH